MFVDGLDLHRVVPGSRSTVFTPSVVSPHMPEQHTDAPVAPRATLPQARKPFVRPAVEDMGGLTLVTLAVTIPVGP
jgi:hypothetical protein